jgi:hypothetical protein
MPSVKSDQGEERIVEGRHCGNCGHELSEDARFCPECGQPVHETAHVPTPEADVPVPPSPGQSSAGYTQPRTEAPPQQQGSMVGRSFGAGFGASIGWIVGGCVVTIVLLMVLFGGCMALIAGSQ